MGVEKRKRRFNGGALARRLAIAVLCALLLLELLELGARIAEPGPFTFLDRRPYLPDPTLRHVHRPGFEGNWEGTYYRINSLGLHSPEIAREKASGEWRAICLGDSCTFGKGVQREETWPSQLQGLLEEVAPPLVRPVAVNCGVNAYRGKDYAEMLRRTGLSLDPDLVVVGYNLNDFPNVTQTANRAVYEERALKQILPQSFWDDVGRSALFRWVRASYYEWNLEEDWEAVALAARGAAGEALDPALWDAEEAVIRGLVSDARGAGAEVVLLLFPYESQVYIETFDRGPIEWLERVAASLDVPFVDLGGLFREHTRSDPTRRLFIRGDRYHPTPEGYRITAERVRDIVLERGWLSERSSLTGR